MTVDNPSNNNDAVKGFIANFVRLPQEKLDDTTLLVDCFADSFQAIELLMALQDEFQFILSHEDMAEVDTVGALLSLIDSRRM